MAPSDHPAVSRRDALRRLATGAMGTAVVPLWVESLAARGRQQMHATAAHAVLTSDGWKPRVLTAWQNEAVTVLTELIVPETDTPGATAARVNRFVDQVLRDAPPAERNAFFQGLAWLDARSKTMFGRDLLDASPEEQATLLTRASPETGEPADRIGREFFQALKSLTISGYYSTEIGLQQELGDDGQLVHAEFRGCDHPEHG